MANNAGCYANDGRTFSHRVGLRGDEHHLAFRTSARSITIANATIKVSVIN
jgi:hypothetical protein